MQWPGGSNNQHSEGLQVPMSDVVDTSGDIRLSKGTDDSALDIIEDTGEICRQDKQEIVDVDEWFPKEDKADVKQA